jgi:hypothetical protein
LFKNGTISIVIGTVLEGWNDLLVDVEEIRTFETVSGIFVDLFKDITGSRDK